MEERVRSLTRNLSGRKIWCSREISWNCVLLLYTTTYHLCPKLIPEYVRKIWAVSLWIQPKLNEHLHLHLHSNNQNYEDIISTTWCHLINLRILNSNSISSQLEIWINRQFIFSQEIEDVNLRRLTTWKFHDVFIHCLSNGITLYRTVVLWISWQTNHTLISLRLIASPYHLMLMHFSPDSTRLFDSKHLFEIHLDWYFKYSTDDKSWGALERVERRICEVAYGCDDTQQWEKYVQLLLLCVLSK